MDFAREVASYLAPERRVMCCRKYKRDDKSMYLLKVHNGVSMLDGSDNEIALFDNVKSALTVFCQTGCKTWFEVWVDNKKVSTFEIMTTSGRGGCSLEEQYEFQDLVTTFTSLH